MPFRQPILEIYTIALVILGSLIVVISAILIKRYIAYRKNKFNPIQYFERVQKVEVLGQGFEVPADFSPAEYARWAFGIFGGKAEEVELVFDASIAGYVRERNWHESQRLDDAPDGGVRLTMEVAPSFDLKAWVKGFLPHVRVERPASLREEIARELAAARAAFPVPPVP